MYSVQLLVTTKKYTFLCLQLCINLFLYSFYVHLFVVNFFEVIRVIFSSLLSKSLCSVADRKDSIAEPLYALISEVFELKGGMFIFSQSSEISDILLVFKFTPPDLTRPLLLARNPYFSVLLSCFVAWNLYLKTKNTLKLAKLFVSKLKCTWHDWVCGGCAFFTQQT